MTQTYPNSAILARTRGWMWNAAIDRSLTPENCSRCLDKRRAEPWAHLLHQEDFADLYPRANFSMGKPNSSLNKITLFQLRQMIVEAGFKITGTDQTNCSNEPPAELLGPPHYFGRYVLRTWMYRVAAVKARDMHDLYPAKS
jgi:hypothetical protein